MKISVEFDWNFWVVGISVVRIRYPAPGKSIRFHIGPCVLEVVL